MTFMGQGVSTKWKDVNMLIPPSATVPAVFMDLDINRLYIMGRSIPENPLRVYQPLIDLIERLPSLRLKYFDFCIDLTYLNTSSLKIFFQIFKGLARLSKNLRISIYWYVYEDQDLHDIVDDISEELVDISISVITKK